MSYANKNGVDFAPLALIGALGVVGYLAYDYLSSNGGSYIGGSGGGYYAPEGSPLMAAGGYTYPTESAPASSSYNPLNSLNAANDGRTANAQFIADSKKEQITSNSSDTLLRAAVSGAGYTQLSSADIATYNANLLKSIEAEDRTGGGSVGSALSFMGIGQGAQYIATIPNTAGISNAGANLTSIVYDTGAYEVRDFRGNIVGSGSAGSFQALGTATKKEEKTTATAGAVSTPYTTATISGGGSSKVYGSTPYSFDANKVLSEIATAKKEGTLSISKNPPLSSGGGSSSSSKKSTVSSGGYAQGGAVRSNTTAGKYTGK